MSRLSTDLALFSSVFFFFFNDTATTEIYTLSLHDALPISPSARCRDRAPSFIKPSTSRPCRDRKSTRLNSSHEWISYAVFCLKKKNDTGEHGRRFAHETKHYCAHNAGRGC